MPYGAGSATPGLCQLLTVNLLQSNAGKLRLKFSCAALVAFPAKAKTQNKLVLIFCGCIRECALQRNAKAM